MSTKEKIEIKEAVDALKLKVKRGDGLSDVEIEGALAYKGLVLKTTKIGGEKSVTVLTREQAEELTKKMLYAVGESRRKEFELKQNRVIDFRLSKEMRSVFRAYCAKKEVNEFRSLADIYLSTLVSDEDYYAIHEAVAYKLGIPVHSVFNSHCIDELASQFYK